VSRLLDLLKTAERHRSQRGAGSAKTPDTVSGTNAPAENPPEVPGAGDDAKQKRTQGRAQYGADVEQRIAAERGQRATKERISLEDVRALAEAAGAQALRAQIEADRQRDAEARQREAAERDAAAVEEGKAQL